MSLLTRGIARLSQLEIDADKDWQGKGIANLASVASAMAHGDIVFRGASVLERLAADAGKGYSFLKSRGPGLPPVWEDIESLVQFMTGAANRAVAFDLAVPMPALNVVSLGSPGGGEAFAPELSIAAPSISREVKSTIVSAVNGAVSHNEDVGDTDETIQANSADANDMTLLPADGAINDCYALGNTAVFDAICIDVGTAGADYSLTYEYSKGSGVWGALTILHNSTNEWKSSGKGWLTFSRPVDWATDTLAGIASLYWVRARATSVGAGFVHPLGNQAWILGYS